MMTNEKIPNNVIKAIESLNLKKEDDLWDAGFRATQLKDVEEWLESDENRKPRDILLVNLISEKLQ